MSESTKTEYRLVEAGTNRTLITYYSESDAVSAWLKYSPERRNNIRVVRAIIESISTLSYLEWSKANG